MAARLAAAIVDRTGAIGIQGIGFGKLTLPRICTSIFSGYAQQYQYPKQ